MANQSESSKEKKAGFPTYIMIVDNRLENILFLSKILNQRGYLIRYAINGIMALQAIKTSPPNLILLDVKMPEMSGFEVCQKLKSNSETAHIPIIFLSAANNMVDKTQVFKVGGVDYINKPFYMEEVLARVQHQLTIINLNTQLEEKVKERTKHLEIANAQLAEMAFHDSLTKLANRALLMQRLREAIEKQKLDSNSQFALFYLDCDRFKDVNDSLGHQAGDELLIDIAQRLKSVVRQEDLVARLGGDEFVILLFNISDSHIVAQIGDRILQSFSVPFHLKGREIFVSFSIGIVSDSGYYTNPEEILQAADIAMYQAKSSGKDQYHISSATMQQSSSKSLVKTAATNLDLS